MKLSLDPHSSIQKKKCLNCHAKYLNINAAVIKDGSAYAAAFIECHRHLQKPEIFLTIILDAWGDDAANHVTFACRYGAVYQGDEMACSLTDVPETYMEPIFGRKLSRAEALKHPRVDEFWQVVDFILENNLAIHNYLYHPRKGILGLLKGNDG